MTVCVLDASFTFQWLFEDESSPEGDAALDVVGAGGAAIPALWFVEVANVLGLAERRGRLTQAGVGEALQLLRSLPLTVDGPASLTWSESVLGLMRTHRLTAYDATYLELANRLGLPLATKDRQLRVAASVAGRSADRGRDVMADNGTGRTGEPGRFGYTGVNLYRAFQPNSDA